VVVQQSADGTFSHCVCVSASARRGMEELVLCQWLLGFGFFKSYARAEIWDAYGQPLSLSVSRSSRCYVDARPALILRSVPVGDENPTKNIPLLPFRSDPLNYGVLLVCTATSHWPHCDGDGAARAAKLERVHGGLVVREAGRSRGDAGRRRTAQTRMPKATGGRSQNSSIEMLFKMTPTSTS
jgi:hypothetical protein